VQLLNAHKGELLPENRYEDWAEARRAELAELASELEELAAFSAVDAERLFGLPAEASSFVELASLADERLAPARCGRSAR
jgi:hypothetical protein